MPSSISLASGYLPEKAHTEMTEAQKQDEPRKRRAILRFCGGGGGGSSWRGTEWWTLRRPGRLPRVLRGTPHLHPVNPKTNDRGSNTSRATQTGHFCTLEPPAQSARHWHLACLLLPLARVPLVCSSVLSGSPILPVCFSRPAPEDYV